jgi:predicted ATPase
VLTAEVMTIAAKQDFPMLLHQASMIRGWALADRGHALEAIGQIRKGLVEWKAMGQELECSHFLGLLAEACRKAGRQAEGLDVVAEAIAVAERIGEGFWQAELYRVRGDLLLDTGAPSSAADAEEWFRKALAVAGARGAKALELRAATSLARLWQRQGRQHEALQALGAIERSFTEGFDTRDLIEARALRDALTGGS